MTVETTRAVSDRSDETPPAVGDADLPSLSALPSHVEPHGATGAKRVDVRVGRDGTATVGRKRLRFSRSLAGALVTVPTPQKEVG